MAAEEIYIGTWRVCFRFSIGIQAMIICNMVRINFKKYSLAFNRLWNVCHWLVLLKRLE